MFPGWVANTQSSFICRPWRRWRSNCKGDWVVSLILTPLCQNSGLTPFSILILANASQWKRKSETEYASEKQWKTMLGLLLRSRTTLKLRSFLGDQLGDLKHNIVNPLRKCR